MDELRLYNFTGSRFILRANVPYLLPCGFLLGLMQRGISLSWELQETPIFEHPSRDFERLIYKGH